MQEIEINNFKKFSTITIPLNREILTINGPSGSGKSQILYALMLFFQCHNHNYYQYSKYGNTLLKNKILRLYISPETHKLLHPSFPCPSDFSEYIHDKEILGPCSTFCGTDNLNKKINVTLNINGSYHLSSNKNVDIKGIYRYIYMGHTFYFGDESENIKDELKSNNIHIRTSTINVYINDKYWGGFMKNIKLLFPLITNIKMDKYSILITEKITKKFITPSGYVSDFTSEKTLEVKNMGTAFQKIFASLVLLYNLLINRKLHDTYIYESIIDRYFLIEEPECLLDSALLINFYNLIRNICIENNIKLIVVSNSQYIIQSSKDVYQL